MRPRYALMKPGELAPYFVFAGLVHAFGVASRFDLLAAKLPEGAPLAIMLAQFPLLYLSGYFESRLDYGNASTGPLWMRIDSKAVKLCFAFGFMYLVVVAAQTWDINFGPVNPSPPRSFPPWQRAMWFTVFTGGGFFLFYMAAASLLIPLLRLLTWPLRLVPPIVAAVAALAIGSGLGVMVLAGVQSTKIAQFVTSTKAAIRSDPAIFAGVMVGVILVPLVIGMVLEHRRGKE